MQNLLLLFHVSAITNNKFDCKSRIMEAQAGPGREGEEVLAPKGPRKLNVKLNAKNLFDFQINRSSSSSKEDGGGG